MRRLIVVALASLSLTGCSSMELFETLGVLSDAYAIKQCRAAYDRDDQPFAYAGCEDFYDH